MQGHCLMPIHPLSHASASVGVSRTSTWWTFRWTAHHEGHCSKFSSMCVACACLRLTDVELLDNLLLLLLAGHDTSSSTLTLAMANLQQHPEVRLQRGGGLHQLSQCQLSEL